ncbi:MAG: sensor histidine kinase [Alphaproteobacteria bacterium]|jgi:two-component system NarL family sensor kinase|nr:MAG: sensor histidine kinase [Alphaproteobacteria bacterium]
MEQGFSARFANDASGAPLLRLVESSIDARAEKRALFRLLARVEEMERHRIARELHDTTAQDLVAINLNLRMLGRRCRTDATRALLDETCALIDQTQNDLRTMSYVLHPPPVTDSGLGAALEAMVRGLAKRARFHVRFESNIRDRLPHEVEEALYRVAQEALINAGKHASPSAVTIRCNRVGQRIELEIEDDGVGFDAGGESAMLGVGLRSIQARVSDIGGRVSIKPGAAAGTLIRVSVSLACEPTGEAA